MILLWWALLIPPPPGFRDDNLDDDMNEDASMTDQDSHSLDIIQQTHQAQPLLGLISTFPTTATDSDLVQRFFNNPDLLRQLQLAQMNPPTPEERPDPKGARES
jgi:hypothetical protein